MRSHSGSKECTKMEQPLQETAKERVNSMRRREKYLPKRAELAQSRRQKRRIERSIRAQAIPMEHISAIEGRAIVAFDLELAGTFPDDIIEIGAIRLQEGVEHIAVFHELIRPRTFVNRTVREMTGLDKEDFKGKESLPHILPAFLQFVGEESIVLGHAIGDNDLLSINLALARIARKTGRSRRFCPPYLDTVGFARSVLPKETVKFNLEALLQRFGWQAKQKHRAFDDAIGAYLLFESLLGEMQKVPSFPSLFDRLDGKKLVLERFDREAEK